MPDHDPAYALSPETKGIIRMFKDIGICCGAMKALFDGGWFFYLIAIVALLTVFFDYPWDKSFESAIVFVSMLFASALHAGAHAIKGKEQCPESKKE